MTVQRKITPVQRPSASGKPSLDARYTAAVIPTGILAVLAQTTLGTPFASINAPRLWGVEVAAHF